tara:strand:- start:1880 stop:2182 length:303 start_codon:yes stop_codon:yes gene_type:complete
MAITEKIEADKIEIVGPYRDVNVRVATIIFKNNVEITRAFSRHIINCQQKDAQGNWEDTDVSGEFQEVQDVCNCGIWTEEIKEAYREANPEVEPTELAEE